MVGVGVPGRPGEEQQPGLGMELVLDQHHLQLQPGWPGGLQHAILSARSLLALGGEEDRDGFPFFQDGLAHGGNLAGDAADVALLHLAVGHAGSRQALLGRTCSVCPT